MALLSLHIMHIRIPNIHIIAHTLQIVTLIIFMIIIVTLSSVPILPTIIIPHIFAKVTCKLCISHATAQCVHILTNETTGLL